MNDEWHNARNLLLEAIRANEEACRAANKPLYDRLAQLDGMRPPAPIMVAICGKCGKYYTLQLPHICK